MSRTCQAAGLSEVFASLQGAGLAGFCTAFLSWAERDTGGGDSHKRGVRDVQVPSGEPCPAFQAPLISVVSSRWPPPLFHCTSNQTQTTVPAGSRTWCRVTVDTLKSHVILFFCGAGDRSQASSMTGKYSVTDPHPSPDSVSKRTQDP